MIDANGDKILTKKEYEDAAIFDWVDSEIIGDPSQPKGACARDVVQCKVHCKIWNEVSQRYKYDVKTDLSFPCGLTK